MKNEKVKIKLKNKIKIKNENKIKNKDENRIIKINRGLKLP